ncbi:hypothetical protein TPA0906_44560 [Streptomyces olivaceus]|uniref:hypothetical protein n=1 Tax=Streptomyces olivaceus TaxID=47716 RepID=UPI0022EF60A5|nr:hypothetical protein [Streptomyces olivaceus]GHJ02591.1 hypothetical protein TPA0906_44560 [Streptomyces olivaceus]
MRSSGVLSELAPLEAARRGPKGLPTETVLVGLVLAAIEKRSTNLDDAWECVQFRAGPHWLPYFHLPDIRPTDVAACRASSKRYYDAWSRISTVLDPARHDRRRRLPRTESVVYRRVWMRPVLDAAPVLSRVANRLVLAPVRAAVARGLLSQWGGDLSVDTTAIPTWARYHTKRRSSLEVSAGYHVSGGGHQTFGYSATLLVAGHADPARSGHYPQLCMGMALHAPGRQIGLQAVRLLETVKQLWPETGFVAGDLAYSDAKVENFHAPVRALGYEPVTDFKTTIVKKDRKAVEGVVAIAGDLLCPHTPRRVIETYHLMAGSKRSKDRQALLPRMEQAESYVLPLKQSADDRGIERRQCPAAGTSPRVTCTWAQERAKASARRRPRRDAIRARRPGHSPRETIDLTDLRARKAHPDARPTVRPPNDLPVHRRPAICQQATISVPADVMPKLRQELPWGREAWQTAYRSLRSHIEGLNGRAKNVNTFLDAREKRQCRGRVAQTLLAAIQLMVENLRTIESFLRDQRRWSDEHYTLMEIPQTPDPFVTAANDSTGVRDASPSAPLDPPEP